MDLDALAGAYPLACLPLAVLYPAANRIWGDDPRHFIGKKLWTGRRIFILLMIVLGIPLGYLSAGWGGAAMPLLFGAWRAIIIGNDWATPDTPKEIVVAFVRDMIPAILVAGALIFCAQDHFRSPFEWPLFWALAVHAVLAVGLAVGLAHKEKVMAARLAAGQVSQTDCDDEMDDATAMVEMGQGLTFIVAVIVWTLLR